MPVHSQDMQEARKMRNRVLKASFWTDGDIILSLDAYGRLLYQGLWCMADDSGVFSADAVEIKGAIFPIDPLTLEQLQGYIDILAERSKIVLFRKRGKTYGWLVNFWRHQKLDRPAAPVHPLPDWVEWRPSRENRRQSSYSINVDKAPAHLRPLLNDQDYAEEESDYSDDGGRPVDGQWTASGTPEDGQGTAEGQPAVDPRRAVGVTKGKERTRQERTGQETRAQEPAATFQTIQTAIQDATGALTTPMQVNTFVAYHEDDHMALDVVLEAIRRSGLDRKGMRHAEGILRSWRSKGITDMAGVAREAEEFQAGRASAFVVHPPGPVSPVGTAHVPEEIDDWLADRAKAREQARANREARPIDPGTKAAIDRLRERVARRDAGG